MDDLHWLRREIGTGLMKLLPLRLSGTPAVDTIAATARAWLAALQTTNIAWNEILDSERVSACFEILMRECEYWPQPKQFLHHLPSRKPPALALISRKLSEDECARNRKRIRALIEKLAANKKPPYLHKGEGHGEKAI